MKDNGLTLTPSMRFVAAILRCVAVLKSRISPRNQDLWSLEPFQALNILRFWLKLDRDSGVGAVPIAVISDSPEETAAYVRLAVARGVPREVTSELPSSLTVTETLLFTCERQLLLEIEFASHLHIVEAYRI